MILTINDYKFNIYNENISLFKSIDKYISINENNDNTFEWDFTADVKKDSQLIKKLGLGLNTVLDYIKKALIKLNKLPHNIKLKLFKTIVLSFMTVLSYTQIESLINNTVDDTQSKLELKNVVKTLYNNTDLQTKLQSSITKYKELKSEFKAPETYSKDLIPFLKYEEGSAKHKGEPVLTAYAIGDGMVTIGYGHAEPRRTTKLIPGKTTITKKQANALLLKDMAEAKGGLDRLLLRWKEKGVPYDISQGMYDSMVSMIFNMGIGNFLKSNFIKHLKHGNYETAREKILTTNVNYPGLIKRRKNEFELFNI